MTNILVSKYTAKGDLVTLHHSQGVETRSLTDFQEWSKKKGMPELLNSLRHIHDDLNRWTALYRTVFGNWLTEEAEEKEMEQMQEAYYTDLHYQQMEAAEPERAEFYGTYHERTEYSRF